jgi:Family of unknown function (DUF6188)
VGIEYLKEKVCTRVYENYPANFTFEFDDASLAVDCLWRIKVDSRVALTSYDHTQQFGLPAPVDAHAEAISCLKDRRVSEVALDEKCADLTLVFEGQIRLEIVTDSSGYEPWNFTAPGVHLVALGGGGIADFSPKA